MNLLKGSLTLWIGLFCPYAYTEPLGAWRSDVLIKSLIIFQI